MPAITGCDVFTNVVVNSPVPWRWNCAPTSAMYAGEFWKQNDAEWIGSKPLPPATKSSSACS